MRKARFAIMADLEIQRVENQKITIAMAKADGNRAKAAELLGMSLRTLKRRIEERRRND